MRLKLSLVRFPRLALLSVSALSVLSGPLASRSWADEAPPAVDPPATTLMEGGAGEASVPTDARPIPPTPDVDVDVVVDVDLEVPSALPSDEKVPSDPSPAAASPSPLRSAAPSPPTTSEIEAEAEADVDPGNTPPPEPDTTESTEATDASEETYPSGDEGLRENETLDATAPPAPDLTPDPAAAPEPEPEPEPVAPFRLLESEIPPGTLRRVAWYPPDSFSGLSEPTPVLVAHGSKPGPVLCLTAAIHGDELNGIEMVRRVVYALDPEELSGTLIGVPIVNLQGFRQGSRYLMDRRDLNRHFPGHRRGSAASRIAHSLFSQIIVHCNALVDLHTGSFHRTNLPQVRGDLRIDAVAALTQGFGATSVLNGGGPPGSLRRAATDIGIPAVTLEAGEPLRFQPEEVDHGVRALRSLLNHLEMVPRFRRWGEPQPVYYESQWVRANEGGILVSRVSLGAAVRKGELLGTVTDPITNRRVDIRAPFDGRVLGMALNQSVIPGFAAYHLGIRRTESELVESPVTVDALGNPVPEAVVEPAPGTLSEEGTGAEVPTGPENPNEPMDPERLADG